MAFSQEAPDSFEAALKTAKRLLSRNHDLVRKGAIETEAEQLVQSAYRKTTGALVGRVELFARLKDRFPERAGELLLVMAMQRSEGVPLQHLTGSQVFLSNEYEVGPDVLVPRPETELLVAEVIDELARGSRGTQPGSMIEIGLGSGIIAIELLFRFPLLRAWASELSEAAARRAHANAVRILGPATNQQGRLKILRAHAPKDVWAPFENELSAEGADLLISNPPYLDPKDEIEPEVRAHEPAAALFAPADDVLHFYREIADGGRSRLKPGGVAWLELPHERAQAILELFEAQGWEAELKQDLTGRDRILRARVGG